jgi:hypothetical protein
MTLKDKIWFWKHVHKLSATNACWLWTGPKDPAGYGVVPRSTGESVAHRLSWRFANHAEPSGRIICHKCDRPSCVRPSHLFIGTHKDNNADMIRKRRAAWQNNTDTAEGYRREVEQWVKDNP